MERELGDVSNAVVFAVIRPTSSLEEVRFELGRCVGPYFRSGLGSGGVVGTWRLLLSGEKSGPYVIPLHRTGREAASSA